jgi:hypothetical protein
MRGTTARLRAVKIVHSVVWAFFAGCIVAIPIAARLGNFRLAGVLVLFVSLEVTVLLFNHLRCPLTDVAARYTDDRRENFDIYLPLFIARHNKVIFGWLFVLGLIYAAARWRGWMGPAQ